jgi:ribosome-associated protein
LTSSQLAECIAAAALEKKAGDVVILDLRKLETLTDYFVICSGDVAQHVRAIVDYVERQMRLKGERVLHREGMESANWVLLDYVNVVVHVFRPSFREFYRLEDLWGDAVAKPVQDEKDLSITRASKKRAVKAKAALSRTAKTARKITVKPRSKVRTGEAKAKPVKKKADTGRKTAVKRTRKTEK